MSKMFQVYGMGQALIPVLPPPLAFENAPTSNQTNYEIGQVVYTPPLIPTDFYMYGGAGNWISLASSSGNISSILGTANQITANTVAGVTTLSLPSAITAPGSLATTTTLTAGTGLTVSAGGAAITGNSTISGNLTLSAATSKLNINAGTPASASTGTSGPMVAGAITITTSACLTTSQIIYSRKTLGTVAGHVSITSQTNGSFTLTSDAATETSTFDYLIIN